MHLNPYAMNAAELRQEADRLAPWHQRIELQPGVVSSDSANDHDLTPALQSAGVAGSSVLDIACNAGLHSLQAINAGARSVFSFDARAHWLAQARFVRDAFGLSVDTWAIQQLDAEEFLPICKRFDVVVAKGILYHLRNPVDFLFQLARIARRSIIINSMIEPKPNPAFSMFREDSALLLSGLNSVCWRPSGLNLFRTFFNTTAGGDWREVSAWETGARCQIVLSRKTKA